MEEESTVNLLNWRKYLSTNKIESQPIAIILRGLLIFGVLFFSGCWHLHNKYESHKVIIPVTTVAENVTVADEMIGIELLNENASRFTKEDSRQYLYENTIYFDRLIYVSEIVIHNSGTLNDVKINDEEESVFISKMKKPINKVNIKVSISSDVLPSDIIYMDMKTIRDPKGVATWWQK